MSETKMEQRLREIASNIELIDGVVNSGYEDAAAIDVGREALKLLREGLAGLGSGDVAASEARIAAARALLARAEGK